MSASPGAGRIERPRSLVTGGAGFVGSNLVHRLLSRGNPTIVLDNLSRPNVLQNLQWLRALYGDRLQLRIADIRDRAAVERAVAEADRVFHLAAQVAVTTSVNDPRSDFAVNAGGTLNVLEAIRRRAPAPQLLFTSTNKVYGDLRDVALRRTPSRYEPEEPAQREMGEERPLEFHSPYGCSKGTADQYVLDYARTYGIPAVVFRMSCIYGPRQFGTEDQGWVAHFLIRALEEQPITLYGDGRQIRDILYVDDLVDAMLLASDRIEDVAGSAFNIGGGYDNSVSLLEVIDRIVELHGSRPRLFFEDWRIGDQRYYVSDTARFRSRTGWRPRISAQAGIRRLYEWLSSERSPISLEVPAVGSG